MDLLEFLKLRDADLSAVMEKVKASVGLRSDDVLLAVGSLVEGLGNSKSDVDLMLITPREASPRPATLVAGRCLIDLRVVSSCEIEELLARFAAWSRLDWAVTHAVKFSLDERTLLHRILHGRVLHEGRRNRILKRLPRTFDLARLKLHVARQASRTIQVDLVGYREVGDFRSMVFAAQEVMGHAIDALAAMHGLTNPLIKWRSRMLGALPVDWARGLMVRTDGLSAGDLVWRLHRAPERYDRKSALLHAARIAAFARAVFLAAELRIVYESGAIDASLIGARRGKWPSTSPADSPALPCLDFDVDFMLGDSGMVLGRLNEFGETLALSPLDFAVTLLFDGTTTVRQAAILVYGSSAEAARRGVNETVLRATQAGLTAPPPSA